VGEEEEKKRYIPYLQHVGIIFSLTREKLREEKITKRDRQGEGGRGEERKVSILLNAYGIFPYKDNHSVILSNHAGCLWI